jgi:AcrR family transcriptional regulator
MKVMTNVKQASGRQPSPLRRTPAQDRSEQQIERVMGAAASLIGLNGPDNVTTTQIAELAGVSIGSLYRYFKDRDAVLEALLQRSETELLGRIKAGGLSLARDDWREAISAALEIQVGFLRDQNTGFHALWFSTTGALAGRTSEANRTTDDLLAHQLVAELPPARLAALGPQPVAVVRLAMGILTKGTELAFSSTDSQGDPVMIAEAKKAAILYLSAYLD